MVLEPTRVSSILDLIFTNKVKGACDVRVVDNLPRTDHDAVLFTTNFQKQRPYTALVRPHLEYCAPVWAPQQQRLIYNIEKVQKQGMWGHPEFKWA